MATTPLPLYPKKLTRVLALQVQVSTLDEEKYFLSKDPLDNLIGDLTLNFLPEVGLLPISIDGVPVPKR